MDAPANFVLASLAFRTRNLPEPVLIADARGDIVAMNDAARSLYGELARPGKGTSDWPQRFRATRNDGSRLRAEDFPINRAIAGNTVHERLLVHIGAQKVYVESTARPVFDGQQIVGAISIHSVRHPISHRDRAAAGKELFLA
jgi:PAS domain-containing protein